MTKDYLSSLVGETGHTESDSNLSKIVKAKVFYVGVDTYCPIN